MVLLICGRIFLAVNLIRIKQSLPADMLQAGFCRCLANTVQLAVETTHPSGVTGGAASAGLYLQYNSILIAIG